MVSVGEVPDLSSRSTAEDLADYLEAYCISRGSAISRGQVANIAEDMGVPVSRAKTTRAWNLLRVRSGFPDWPFSITDVTMQFIGGVKGLSYAYLCVSYFSSAALTQDERNFFETYVGLAMRSLGCTNSLGMKTSARDILPEVTSATGADYFKEVRGYDKDITIDTVAWSDFDDGRGDADSGLAPKKLYVGQCASGSDWVDKVKSEPNRDLIHSHISWIYEPVYFFATPAYIGPKALSGCQRNGRLILDRPRLLELMPCDSDLPPDVQDKMQQILV